MDEMTVYYQVLETLKKHDVKDEEFVREVDQLHTFYGKKLITTSTTDELVSYIETDLFDLVKSQIFQGYFIMTSILNDTDTQLPSEVWSLNKGIVRNEIPIVLTNVFESANDWYRTEIGHKVGMNLVNRFNVEYALIQQIRKDIAMYGAYKAFLDDKRYVHQDTRQNEFILGNPLDLTFLNPQIYMQTQFITEEQEIWDLYWWSALNSNSWVGTVHLSKIPGEQQTFFLLQITLSETIALHERYEIVDHITSTIPSEIKSVLQMRVNHVREMEILIPS